MRAYTIEELIDVVQGELTISCALPKLLPDLEIRRIIENKAAPWFYQNYYYAVQKIYYYIDKRAFHTDEFTKYRYITLPCEIQTISWIYETRDRSLFNVGINAPNLSINLGVTNQPYLSSYVTTIGELGVYKTVLDSFSDMLDILSKYTVKFQYNQMNNRLNILSGGNNTLSDVGHHYESMILEAYANVENEALFADPMFVMYVTGLAKQQLGALMTRYNFNLPGGIQYNGDSLISEGKEEMQRVIDEIKGQSNSAWFVMVKR
jgi:hypothetical protein